MNIMKKRLFCALLAGMTVLSLASCNNSGDSNSTPDSSDNGGSGSSETAESVNTSIDFDSDPYEVHFMYLVAKEGSNQATIQEQVNALTLENLNMTVDLIPMTMGAYNSTISTSLASNEPLDMMPVFSSSFDTYIESGYLVNLYDYEEYLTGVKEQMGDTFYAGDIGGFLTGFTEMKEWGFPCGLIVRKDIFDELGYSVDDFSITAEDMSTFQQMDDLFAAVKEAYPNMIALGGTANMTTQGFSWFDGLGNSFGVLANFAKDTTVTNWYESQQYYDFCTTFGRWFDAGYTSADVATNQDSGETLMRAGNLFSFITYYKPNTAVEKLAQTGYEVEVIPMSEYGIKSNASINSLVYSLANASEDKTKAAQFMNFAYTSGELNDLLNWGVEGEDWIEDENGQAAYPEGIDANNAATHNDFGWGLPNQFVGHAWAGNPVDIWDQYREYNDSMVKSVAYGFGFSGAEVTSQITQCTSVQSEYASQLGFGVAEDIDASIAEFNEKLYNAGLQDIMDAKQEQLDAWFAENGTESSDAE